MFRLRLDDDLELGLLQARDAPAVFVLVDANRAYLRAWLPWVDHHRDVTAAEAFIRKALDEFAGGKAIHAGIWYGGVFAGVVGYHRIDQDNGVGEIGYWLGEAFQGRGLMTRACRAMVAYGFDELGLNRVEIRCAPANRRSCAIPERLGFQAEGTLRQAERLGDHYVDHVVYALLAEEYGEVARQGSLER